MLFFLLIEILPGDFAEISAGRITSFAAVDKQRAAYGLDEGISIRYWRWLTQALQGEFGDSWWSSEPIGPMLWKRLGHTLWLAMLSAFVSLPLGFALGVISAIYVGRTFDRSTSLGVLALTSVPAFVVAYIMMYVLAVEYQLFPVHTFFTDKLGFWGRVHASVLPALSLAGISIAPVLRMTRATVLNVFQAPFMQMAHLKGLSLWHITWRHAIPNIIAPVSTTTVLVIANLVVGVVIIESIFSYPGFGQAMIMAAQNRDVPLALACGIISGALYLLLNLMADIVVLFSNPRLRHPSSTQAAATWIIPPSLVLAWKRPRAKFAMVIIVFVASGLGYGYFQWTKTDGVTHSNITPALWFRTKLEAEDLLNDTDYYLEPVHYSHFLAVGEHKAPLVKLEGTIKVPTFQLLSRIFSRPSRWPGFVEAPGFDVTFVTIGHHLVPLNAGAILETHMDGWSVIVDEGRVWSEPDDGEWSRAAFPFTLIHHNDNAAFSAAATFLYTHSRTSQMRVQIAQESVPDDEKYDFWGQIPSNFSQHDVNERNTVEARYLKRKANRLEMRSWKELETLYGAAALRGFDGEHGTRHISVSGLLIDDTAYVRPCRTRFGPYPFCESYRHSLYSMANTLGASVAMLHLSEVLGEEIFTARVLDYIAIDALHDGWRDVTFGDLLNMSSGIGDDIAERVEHFVDLSEAKTSLVFSAAPTSREKLRMISTVEDYPWGPNEVFRYQDTHTFLLSLAMRHYLRKQRGPNSDVWETLQRDVFDPLALGRLDVFRSHEPDGELGVPLLDASIYPTVEQALKLTRLLQNHGVNLQGQLLHKNLTKQAVGTEMQRGLPTGNRYSARGDEPSGEEPSSDERYDMGFWLIPFTGDQDCVGRIPFMVGKGGSYIGLMPNNITAFRFADGWGDEPGTWDSAGLQAVANRIRPFCGAAD